MTLDLEKKALEILEEVDLSASFDPDFDDFGDDIDSQPLIEKIKGLIKEKSKELIKGKK